MAKAVVDPDELRRFAAELKRFTDAVQAEVLNIRRRFIRLGETWRDQEHAKFAEEFEQMVHVLSRFAETSARQVPILQRKAEGIQQYLDQR